MPLLDFNTAKAMISRLDALYKVGDPIEARDHGLDVLRFLDNQAKVLSANANDYPENPTTADIFMDGVGLANQAEIAAAIFRIHDAAEFELHATRICANMTCSVQGHYHHVVGPRMVAFMDCLLRQDDVATALAVSEAIVADFDWILEDWEAEMQAPTDEDRISLESLQSALELQSIHGKPEVSRLLESLEEVLSRN